ncbi:Cellulase (glycosyl hydrolase family 5 protein) [Ceratobasidium sp. AG-Ba]|nr:Cellulase (glycosyl hydrolase family 5 protein) [Ceratobasidium sp. AG-Ba]
MSSSPRPESPSAMQTDTLLPPKAVGLQTNRDSVATTASAEPSIKAHDSSSYMGVPVNDLPHHEDVSEKPKRKRNPLVYALRPCCTRGHCRRGYCACILQGHQDQQLGDDWSSNNGSGGNPSMAALPEKQPDQRSGNDCATALRSPRKMARLLRTTTSLVASGSLICQPYNNSAQAQSWSPPLSQEWKYGPMSCRQPRRLLVLEPFISPALYEPYQPSAPNYGGIWAIDEWTLCEAIAANKSSGGVAKVLEEHYATFITEEDFAQIAGAGLNWFDDEPFLERVSWKYFLKAIEWARKYGLRINLDLHTIPGSQNGFNHSGKRGQINWMHGVMGLANAQRSLNIMRTITEFISQDQYKDVVPFFGVVNEAQTSQIGIDTITSFYIEMHDMMRNITGYGKGPFISIHDGFQPLEQWVNFLPGSDRIALDSHPYFATLDDYGFAAAGEWSLAFNDCGLYLNGASSGYRYDGTLSTYNGPRIGSCDPWLDSTNWSPTVKQNLKELAMTSMDAMQNYFFWTWKIGKSNNSGKVNSPLWSYSLGLENGWIPTDPREAAGACGNTNPRSGPLKPSQTSYVSQTIAASLRASHPFPPTSFADQGNVAALPSYTPTGTPHTLPAPTFTAATVSAGSGWVGGSGGWDGDYVPIEGCTYPDPWDAVGAAVPSRCTGRRRLVREPRITDAPVL